MSRAPIATRQRFIRWLADRSPEEVVGTYMVCSTCPLARFLEYLEPGCMPWVARRGWTRWENAQPVRPLPDWAKLVINVADSPTLMLNYGEIKAGTLRTALREQLGWRFEAGA